MLQRKTTARAVSAAALAVALIAGSGTELRASFTDPSTDFTVPPDTFTAQTAVAVATADFDGDGKTDIAVGDAAAAGNTVRVLRNDGTGKAFDADSLIVGGPSMADMAIGLIDAGTTPDFAVASGSSVVVGRNNGVVVSDVTFLTSVPADVDAQATIRKIVIADYDQDGFGDVIAAGDWFDIEGTKGFVAVLKGDGTTVALAPNGLEVLNDPVTALAAADLDGDDFPEIVTGSESGATCRLFANPATGLVDLGFGQQSVPSVPLHARAIAIGDVTRDGKPDVVVAGWEDYQSGQNRTAFTILRNTGETPAALSYVIQVTHSFPDGADVGAFDCGVAIGDVDDTDGAEIIASAPLESSISVFHFDIVTDGGGAFVALTPGAVRKFTGTGAPVAVAVGSINPDDDSSLDVVTTNTFVNQSAIWFNADVPIEEPDDDDPPAGGDPLPASTNLTIKVNKKPVKNAAFQVGKKITFTCTQPARAPGMKVRVQSTTTPLDEPSWEDVFAGEMTRGTGKKNADTWTVNVAHVPGGTRWFRTVTSAPGYPDGIGDTAGGTASLPNPADGYIGPYQVTPAGSVLLVSTRFASINLGGERTYRGDRLFFLVTVQNTGTTGTGSMTVTARTPNDTDFVQAGPLEGFTRTAFGTTDRLEWEVADLPAGKTATFAYTVDVSSRGNPNGVDWTATTDTSTASKVKQITDPPTGTKVFIPFVSPLTLDVRAITPSPLVGGTMTYELIAENTGTTDFEKCVVTDRLPDGTSFDVAYFSDEAGDVVTNSEQWGDGRMNPAFDRASRKVFWLLGTLRAGEKKRMRLVVNVQNDVEPGTTLTNGAFELRGCKPGDTNCTVLDLATLQSVSAEPYDVRVSTSLTEPEDAPEFRVTQFALTQGAGGALQIAGFGVVRPVEPGAEFTHQVVIENRGDSPALGVRVQGNIAQQVDFVAGSVVVTPTKPAGAPYTPAFTLSSGGTLEVVVGDMGPNTIARVEYRARIKTSATPRSLVTAPNWAVSTDSLSRLTFAAPSSLSVLVAPTFVPQWTFRRDVREIEVGDRITYTIDLTNEGNSNGVNCEFTMGIPAGAVVSDDEGDPADGLQRLDAAGNVVGTFPVAANAKSFTVPLGTVPPGNAGSVRVTFEYLRGKKGATSLASTASFRGTPGGASKGPAAPPPPEAKGTIGTVVTGAGQTKLVTWLVGDPVAFSGGKYDYHVVVGNVGDEDANGVVLSVDAPAGTTRSAEQTPSFQPNAKASGSGATWNLGTIPAHTAQVRTFRVDVSALVVKSVIVQDTVSVKLTNGTAHLPAPLRSLVVSTGRTFKGFRWAATAEVLRGLGMQIQGSDADLAQGIVTLVRPDKLSVMSNSDCVQLCGNGHYVAPLGGGNALVVGFARIASGAPAGAHTFLPVDDRRGNIAFGPGDTMNVPTDGNNAGFQTARYILDHSQEYVQAGCANILVGLTNTLVNKRGTSQVSSDPAGAPVPIVRTDAGNLINVGGDNIVAAGGGNIVAAGGGNLIGNDGAGIVAAGGGNIVAAGGGNIVAAGAGNLIGDGGGTLIGNDGAGLIGDGGGTKR